MGPTLLEEKFKTPKPQHGSNQLGLILLLCYASAGNAKTLTHVSMAAMPSHDNIPAEGGASKSIVKAMVDVVPGNGRIIHDHCLCFLKRLGYRVRIC